MFSKNTNIIRGVISGIAMLFVILHLWKPELHIDTITLFLIVIGISPWIGPLLKSLEFPGGIKIEFKDIEPISKKAEKIGIFAKIQNVSDLASPFLIVVDEDPNLALAGLRLEIEKRLRKLSEIKQIDIKYSSVRKLLNILKEKGVLSEDIHSMLSDMLPLLNKAVHGAQIERNALRWVIDIGIEVLNSLDKLIEQESREVKNA